MTVQDKILATAYLRVQVGKMQRSIPRMAKIGAAGPKLAEQVARDCAALEALLMWLEDREMVRREAEMGS